MSFHRHSIQWSQPGLYVGILKLCSSVDQIRVLVPQRLPNLLCHTRVRHNAHVTREEWAWLQSHVYTAHNDSVQSQLRGMDDSSMESSGLAEFVRSLRAAITHLLTKLNIPLYRAYQYGVYTQELLQFGENISMLLLLPPSEDFSSSYWPLVGTKEPGLTMPLQTFELVHFWTYEQDFLCQYCQAWVRLELDSHLAQQAQREALDTKELQEARERLSNITELFRCLDVVWRGARWIMDCLQCVRSKQWVGAVPLGLVMGGDPPPCPDGEEEEEKRLTTRLKWANQIQTQRSATETSASVTSAPTAELSTPERVPVVPEEDLVLMEGVVKGGYPVDLSAQPPADLVNLDCASSLLESGLEPAAVAQFEAGYLVLGTQESYSRETSFPPSISEVIQPMEIAELVDILPTLSLIEEENATGPTSPSVMDMLENFGLGIGERNASFDFRSSRLISGDEALPHPLEAHCENMEQREEEAASVCDSASSVDDETPALSWDFPREGAKKPEAESRGTCLPVRSLVEWDKPSSSSS